MKPRTLARLALLATEREAQLGQAVAQQRAALLQNAAQREMLDAYRARLAAGWQNGAVVAAAQARRAGQFTGASQTAAAQMEMAAELAAQQLEHTIDSLGQVQAYRRALGRAQAKATRAQAQAVQRSAERDLPNTRPTRETSPIKPEGA